MDRPTSYHNHFYVVLLLSGLFIIIASIYFSNSKIETYEHNTNRIHRLITASEIELDTLEREAKSIERTLNDLSAKLENPETKSEDLNRQFFSLKISIDDLRGDIAEKQKLLISLNLLKTGTLTQVKTLFWINSALLVLGTLLSILGGAALGFHLEIFKDRRQLAR